MLLNLKNYFLWRIDAIGIKVENRTHIIPKPYHPNSERKIKVTSVGKIIVYPVPEDRQELLEIVRDAELGERLQGNPRHRDRDDYISIYLNDETAYIHKDMVEEL